MGGHAPEIPVGEIFRRFWPDARGLRGKMALGLVLVILAPAAAAGELWMFKILIDDVLVPRNIALLPTVAAAYLGLTLVGGGLSFANQYRLGEASAYLPGYGYSIQRSALLGALTARAGALGIEVRHDRALRPAGPPALPTLEDADLVVGADGTHSAVRALHRDAFGTTTTTGGNRYIRLGTTKVFDRFTFALQRTGAGWLWFHAYPSGAARGEPARWTRFTEVVNRTWHHGNTVLLGDAARTTHFTIGSGTRLAMIGAVTLAQSVYEHRAVADALRAYEDRRRGALEATQASARASQAWFEHLDHYAGQDVSGLAYSMSSRQGQQPPWRYQKHLMAQLAIARGTRRRYDTVRRWYFAGRRGEAPLTPPIRTPHATFPGATDRAPTHPQSHPPSHPPEPETETPCR
jgi:hypothetical protein